MTRQVCPSSSAVVHSATLSPFLVRKLKLIPLLLHRGCGEETVTVCVTPRWPLSPVDTHRPSSSSSYYKREQLPACAYVMGQSVIKGVSSSSKLSISRDVRTHYRLQQIHPLTAKLGFFYSARTKKEEDDDNGVGTVDSNKGECLLHPRREKKKYFKGSWVKEFPKDQRGTERGRRRVELFFWGRRLNPAANASRPNGR